MYSDLDRDNTQIVLLNMSGLVLGSLTVNKKEKKMCIFFIHNNIFIIQ